LFRGGRNSKEAESSSSTRLHDFSELHHSHSPPAGGGRAFMTSWAEL